MISIKNISEKSQKKIFRNFPDLSQKSVLAKNHLNKTFSSNILVVFIVGELPKNLLGYLVTWTNHPIEYGWEGKSINFPLLEFVLTLFHIISGEKVSKKLLSKKFIIFFEVFGNIFL